MLKNIIKSLRIHQWTKNTLVFIPIISGKYFSTDIIISSIYIFIAFCLMSSSTYLLNDCLDKKTDKEHPINKKRPIASGSLSITTALTTSILLFSGSLLLSINTSSTLTALLLGYCSISISYSLFFKHQLIADIIFLALLYTYRVGVSTFALSLEVSFWLFSFSFLLFMGLSFLKRYSELLNIKNQSSKQTYKAYVITDLNLMF
tara:strand:+ start:1035 stop:1646 length:612 start_codon:yes stop_codon:yes gene_type:complete